MCADVASVKQERLLNVQKQVFKARHLFGISPGFSGREFLRQVPGATSGCHDKLGEENRANRVEIGL
jgi:hypothetical protein